MVALIHKHSADGSTARGGRHAADTRDDRTVLALNGMIRKHLNWQPRERNDVVSRTAVSPVINSVSF